MNKVLSLFGIIILLMLLPINTSAQSRAKKKVPQKTFVRKPSIPKPGKVQLTMYCSMWRNCIHGYENGITELSPIERIRMRENNYIEFLRTDGSIWKRFYLPYKSTDIYGEISFCNKAQTIVVGTSFRNKPHVTLVTDEDQCVFFIDAEKTESNND